MKTRLLTILLLLVSLNVLGSEGDGLPPKKRKFIPKTERMSVIVTSSAGEEYIFGLDLLNTLEPDCILLGSEEDMQIDTVNYPIDGQCHEDGLGFVHKCIRSFFDLDVLTEGLSSKQLYFSYQAADFLACKNLKSKLVKLKPWLPAALRTLSKGFDSLKSFEDILKHAESLHQDCLQYDCTEDEMSEGCKKSGWFELLELAAEAKTTSPEEWGDSEDSLIYFCSQRLLLLHHASKCSNENCEVTPHCAKMKKVCQHLFTCRADECSADHCRSSKSVLSHYFRCRDPKCLFCAPFRASACEANGH